MTQIIRIHTTGGPGVLQLEEAPVGEPGPAEARIRHEAIGVNFIDIYHRTGLYPLPHLPHGLGVEAAGVVEAVGDGVTEVAPGERVAYVLGQPGCYAGERLVPAERLVPLPEGIDAATAAGALLKGMTVEYLTRRLYRVEPGMTVILHAAAGGVGLLACQWLAHHGVTVIGTVSSREKAAVARAHGCAHPVVLGDEDLLATVQELTGGQGVPVVYDSVGRDTFEVSLGCLARRGMLVGFGNASGAPPPFDPLELARRGSLFLTRPTLFDYTATREELLQSARALFAVIEAGAVRVPVTSQLPLADAARAHRALEERQTTGSTILVP
jgi:NADPH2:quinone reductase